ncbi:MAG: c-type cytochrome biogenesis protein CcmI [Pseudomonadota bacterium]
MALWFFLLVLSAGAVIAITAPLSRRQSTEFAAQEADLAVYKDQLLEVDADLSRGVITETEAEAAKIEIKRRMLVAAETKMPNATGLNRSRAIVFASAIVVPITAVGTYVVSGNPGTPGQPLASRLDLAPTQVSQVDELVVRVERHLRENPGDGRGWEVLAPVYVSLGRYEEAANAWQRTIQLLGSTPERAGGFGEALVRVSGGVVSDAARQQFQTELDGNPGSSRARYYLALGAEQDGNALDAQERWQALLDDAVGNETWISDVRARILAIETELADGPSSETADEDRQAMIEGMVAGLDQRLTDEGGTVEDWARLIRSYAVLEKNEAAVRAVARARSAFSDDTTAVAQIDALAQSLGLEG